MRRVVTTFSGLSLIVVAAALVSAQGNVNFSGTWVLDTSKSDVSQLLGIGENPENMQNASMTMVVEQQGATFRVTRTLKTRGEERKEIHTYKIGGGETTNTGFRGETVVGRAFWEGDKIVIISSRTRKVLLKEISAESRGVWGLSTDGKTLLIDARVHSLRGDQRVKAVFDRR
jgi:hypothetical protein